MKLCTILLPSLIFLIIQVLNPVPAENFTTVVAGLNQSATLPCDHTCSGLLKWTVTSEQKNIVVAQCNKTLCKANKGFEISHYHYLQGDLDLTVTKVDYSERNWYTCQCDNEQIKLVRLSIQCLMSLVQLRRGENLVLDVPIPETVEVLYSITGSSGVMCTVDGGKLHYKDKYKSRVSFSNGRIILSRVMPSDSGLYTIRDIVNNEYIHIYSVSVKDLFISHVKAELHRPATIPYEGECDKVKWFKNKEYKAEDWVALCNQTSCISKKGYELPYEQFKTGNYSLIITSMDYNMRSWYTFRCNETDTYWVHLCIKTVTSSVRLKAGEDLVLDVPIPERVGVIYNGTMIHKDNSSNKTICTYNKGLLECQDKYTQRVSHALKVANISYSDTAVYIIKDMKTNKTLLIYNVTVEDLLPLPVNSNLYQPATGGFEPVMLSVHLKPREDLFLYIPPVEEVEVIFNGSGRKAADSARDNIIFRITNGTLRCEEKYTHTVSHVLKLGKVNPNDNGVYIIQDTVNNEDIIVYNVTVEDLPKPTKRKKTVILLVALGVLVTMLVPKYLCKRRSPPQNGQAINNIPQDDQNHITESTPLTNSTLQSKEEQSKKEICTQNPCLKAGTS